jgi:hypothetical protein
MLQLASISFTGVWLERAFARLFPNISTLHLTDVHIHSKLPSSIQFPKLEHLLIDLVAGGESSQARATSSSSFAYSNGSDSNDDTPESIAVPRFITLQSVSGTEALARTVLSKILNTVKNRKCKGLPLRSLTFTYRPTYCSREKYSSDVHFSHTDWSQLTLLIDSIG